MQSIVRCRTLFHWSPIKFVNSVCRHRDDDDDDDDAPQPSLVCVCLCSNELIRLLIHTTKTTHGSLWNIFDASTIITIVFVGKLSFVVLFERIIVFINLLPVAHFR